MKSLGPVFVAAVTLDLHLALLFVDVNVAFAFTLTALVFRGRPVVDRWLLASSSPSRTIDSPQPFRRSGA